MDFDEIPNEPEQQATPPSFDEMPHDEAPSFDEMPSEGAVTSSAWGAGLRRGLMEAPVGAAAGVAGLVGSVPGAALGTPAGPPGQIVGGLTTGLMAATAAGAATSKFEDWLLDKLGLRQGSGLLSREQELADLTLHPNTSFIGGLVGQVAPTFGTGTVIQGGRIAAPALMAGTRAIGAGIQGGIEAGQEAYQGEGFSPFKIGASAVAGAAAPVARSWAQATSDAITDPVANAFKRWRGAVQSTKTSPGTEPPAPGTTEAGAQATSMVDAAKAARQSEIATARAEAEAATDPDMKKLWEDHAEALEKGKPLGDPADPIEASQGPDAAQNAFTPADSDKANDITTVSKGIAAENPPTQDIPGTGNGAQGPGTKPAAEGPENYDKAKMERDARIAETPAGEQAPAEKIETGPVSDTIMAAFKKEEGIPAEPAAPPVDSDAVARMRAITEKRKAEGTFGQPITPRKPQPGEDGFRDNPPPAAPPQVPPAAPPQVPPAPRFPPATQRAIAAGKGKTPIKERLEYYDPNYEPPPKIMTAEAKPAEVVRGPEPVQAEPSPEHQAKLKEAKLAIAGSGADEKIQLEMLKNLNNVKDPAKQFRVAEDLISGLAPKEKEVRQHAEETGAQMHDAKAKARADSVHNATKTAAKEFAQIGKDEIIQPYTKADKKVLLDRLQKMYDRAVELNNKNDPFGTMDQGGYKATKNIPLHYRLVKQAKKVLKEAKGRGGGKAISDYRALEQEYLKGGGDTEAANEFGKTSNIDAGIAYRPGLDADLTAAAEPSVERRTFGKYEPDGTESQHEIEQMQGLHDFIDSLSPEAYERLSDTNNIPVDVAGAIHGDPQGVIDAYRKDLEGIEGAEEHRIFPTTREVKTAKDLAPKAENKPTVYERGTPEFEAAAAEALKKHQGPITPRMKPGSPEFKKANAEAKAAEQARVKEEVAARDEGVIEPHEPLTPREQVENGDKKDLEKVADEFLAQHEETEGTTLSAAAKALAKRVIHDTNGAIPVPNWALPSQWNLFSSKVRPEVKEARDQIHAEFAINTGVMRNFDYKINTIYKALPKLTDAEYTTLYQKVETNKPLTTAEQDYWDKVQAIKEMNDRAYRAMRRIDPTLPEPFLGVNSRHVPRLRMDKLTEARIQDEPWKNNLSDWASVTEDRAFKALDNHSGLRFTIHQDPNTGKVTLFQQDKNGNVMPRPVTNLLPAGFTGKLGDHVKLKIKGIEHDFEVDHAITPEIERDTGLRYVKNLALVYANSAHAMQGALIKHNMLERLKDHPVIKANSTTDKEVARNLGYELTPTKLEEMAHTPGLAPKPIYYDKRFKWLFDDFAKPGLDISEKLNRFANAVIRPLYILSPQFHVLNVGANWSTTLLNNPQNMRAIEAIKQVWTQGDVIREIQQAGGRLMKASTLFDGGLVRDMAQNMGYEMARNPGFAETIRKSTGLDMSGIMKAGMKWSNRFMWAGNDMFYTELYMRNRKSGMSPREAVAATERWIGAYDSKSPTFMGARWAQQAMNTSAISYFGRYHQDLWGMLGTVKDVMIGKEKDPQVRKEVGSFLAMSGLMMVVAYPLMDKGVQALTGNEHAEMGRRGIHALENVPVKLYKGKTAEAIKDVGRNVFTPSIPLAMMNEARTNMDWTGKGIIPDVPLNSGKALATAGARAADWTLGQVVNPYGVVSRELKEPHSSGWAAAGAAGKKFLESTVGIKDPSARAIAFEQKSNQRWNRIAKERSGGLLESLVKGR